MTFKEELDKLENHFPAPSKTGPVWDGPESDGPNGGVTFSLLSRFLTCRERFRLYAVEGLQPAETFNHRIEYGNMWHVCEEHVCENSSLWKKKLEEYARGLVKRFPLDREKILHWHRVCFTQYPLYYLHWNRDGKEASRKRQYLFREKVFNVAYPLPSGRVARLRGKWDGLLQDTLHETLRLQENKTKGDVDEQRIRRQLRFDLQTMLYLTALESSTVYLKVRDDTLGVLYNVVRRPLSGGKHTIVRHKPTKANPASESEVAFYERLGGLIRDDPRHYFLRLNVEVTARDREYFRRTCLDPLLENLCDWWETISKHPDCWSDNRLHWRHPYGVYNPLDDGGFGDLDAHLETGSRVGLRVVNTLFPELA